LERVAAAYDVRYPPPFHFQTADAGLDGGSGTALVCQIVPRTVFAFHRGEMSGQTRYRLEEG